MQYELTNNPLICDIAGQAKRATAEELPVAIPEAFEEQNDESCKLTSRFSREPTGKLARLVSLLLERLRYCDGRLRLPGYVANKGIIGELKLTNNFFRC